MAALTNCIPPGFFPDNATVLEWGFVAERVGHKCCVIRDIAG